MPRRHIVVSSLLLSFSWNRILNASSWCRSSSPALRLRMPRTHRTPPGSRLRPSPVADPALDGPGAGLTIDYTDPEARPVRKAGVVAVAAMTDQKPDEGRAGADPAEAPPDRFLHEAAKQYRDGQIDQQLWIHTLAQAKGDKTAAIGTYLKARAESLRRIDHEQQAKARARALREAGRRDADPDPPGGGLWPNENFGVTPALRGHVILPRARRRRAGGCRRMRLAGQRVLVECPCGQAGTGRSDANGTAGPGARRETGGRVREQRRPRGQGACQRGIHVQDHGVEQHRELERPRALRHGMDAPRARNAAAWNQLGIGFSNLRQYSRRARCCRDCRETRTQGSALLAQSGPGEPGSGSAARGASRVRGSCEAQCPRRAQHRRDGVAERAPWSPAGSKAGTGPGTGGGSGRSGCAVPQVAGDAASERAEGSDHYQSAIASRRCPVPRADRRRGPGRTTRHRQQR